MRTRLYDLYWLRVRPGVNRWLVCPIAGHFVKFRSAPYCMRCGRDTTGSR